MSACLDYKNTVTFVRRPVDKTQRNRKRRGSGDRARTREAWIKFLVISLVRVYRASLCQLNAWNRLTTMSTLTAELSVNRCAFVLRAFFIIHLTKKTRGKKWITSSYQCARSQLCQRFKITFQRKLETRIALTSEQFLNTMSCSSFI